MESCHGLSIDALLDKSVTFAVARFDGEAAGCGAVKFVGTDYAELKRMYVRPQWRGHGIARSLLTWLEALSRENGYQVIRLETGVYQHEAQRLYEKAGYLRRPLFGDYTDDPLSLYYEKGLGNRKPPRPNNREPD